MLPPAGQILKNGTSLRFLMTIRCFFEVFKQGASRGAASGGSDFLKNDTSLKMLDDFLNLVCNFQTGC